MITRTIFSKLRDLGIECDLEVQTYDQTEYRAYSFTDRFLNVKILVPAESKMKLIISDTCCILECACDENSKSTFSNSKLHDIVKNHSIPIEEFNKLLLISYKIKLCIKYGDRDFDDHYAYLHKIECSINDNIYAYRVYYWQDNSLNRRTNLIRINSFD